MTKIMSRFLIQGPVEVCRYYRMPHAHATSEHMPFQGHRTVQEVIEDQARQQVLRKLGR